MSNTDDKTLVALINPPFTFAFADKEYQIRKATLEQVQQYQMKVAELAKDEAAIPANRDLEIIAYCVYLSLVKVDSSVTIDFVKENIPGAVDGLSLLGDLGFIDPQKVKMVKKMQDQLISQSSSPTSPIEQDGPQEKSAS